MTATEPSGLRCMRLGADSSFLEKVHTNVCRSAEAERKRENTPYFGTYALSVDTYYRVLLLTHVEFSIRIDNPVRVCNVGARAADTYFYGEWRARAKGRRTKREEANWFDAFSKGLLMALLAGDRQIVLHLLDWPSSECPYDAEFADHTKATQASYVELAATVSGVLEGRLVQTGARATDEGGGRQSRTGP